MKAVNAVKLRIVMNCMTQPPFYYHKEQRIALLELLNVVAIWMNYFLKEEKY